MINRMEIQDKNASNCLELYRRWTANWVLNRFGDVCQSGLIANFGGSGFSDQA